LSDIQGLWNQVFAVGWWLFLIEVILIYLLIYYFIVFCEGTRGAGILKGLALFVLLTVITFRVVVYYFGLERIGFLLTVFSLRFSGIQHGPAGVKYSHSSRSKRNFVRHSIHSRYLFQTGRIENSN